MNAGSAPEPHDVHRRPLKDLRISITDRCNFRCSYCMPLEHYTWLGRDQVLTFEEIVRLARIFVGLGVEKVRLTGGEPLLRKGLEDLVAALAGLEGLVDLSLTTNGAGLASKVEGLEAAGLRRINVSLDSLRPERFERLTKRGSLEEVLRGIRAACGTNLRPVKINAVIIRGENDDEILDLVEFARTNGCEMRFIEYMDAGNATSWSADRTFSKKEILEVIRTRFALEEIGRHDDRAPAVDYRYVDGRGTVGVIGSVTEPFCSSCSRARLTADGKFVMCLFAPTGLDLKTPMRSGATDEELSRSIRAAWTARRDRFSDERLARLSSGVGCRPEDFRKIEMITLGG